MEEILASIRRIIADDDAARIARRASDTPAAPEPPEAFAQSATAPSSSFSTAPDPGVSETYAEPTAGSTAESTAEEDHAAEILDLTESMTARMFAEPEPAPASSPAPDAMAELPEPELAAIHEPEPALQTEEPGPAVEFQEPEPVLEAQEPKPVQEVQEPEQAPQFHATEDYADGNLEEEIERPAMPRPSEQSPRYGAPQTEEQGSRAWSADERGPLLSSATSAAVDSAFNALAHTVLVQNARTLEDLVREMLRPMLKTWLDDNLPGLVERLVRAEIERVARGR